VATEARS